MIAVLAVGDLLADFDDGTTAWHVALEGSVAFTALAGSAFVWIRARALLGQVRDLEAQARALGADLDDARRDATAWRAEASELMRGLGAAIDQQFVRWELTPAEKETAMLLLKGLSLRDVGEVRNVTEATARQQARAVYRKAGLEGRHDLAAFFLEDLLLPGVSADGAEEPAPEGR